MAAWLHTFPTSFIQGHQILTDIQAQLLPGLEVARIATSISAATPILLLGGRVVVWTEAGSLVMSGQANSIVVCSAPPGGLPDGPGAAVRTSCGVAEVEGLINEAVKMLAELLAYQLKTVKFQSLLRRRCKSPWNFGCDML